MRREGAIRLSFCGLFLLVFMSTSAGAWAQENMCIVPTGSGQTLNQLDSALTIIASAEEISPAQPVSLRAAWGCSPFEYTWQVQGTGYSLSKTTTNGDLDYTVLTVASGTCGEDHDVFAVVTVTDACLSTDTVKIRYAGGQWELVWQASAVNEIGCAPSNVPGNWPHYYYSDVDDGAIFWRFRVQAETQCMSPGGGGNWDASPDPPCGTPEQCAAVHFSDLSCTIPTSGCFVPTSDVFKYEWQCVPVP